MGGETETSVGFGEGDEKVGTRSGPDVVVDVGGVDQEGGLVKQQLGDLTGKESKRRVSRRRIGR